MWPFRKKNKNYVKNGIKLVETAHLTQSFFQNTEEVFFDIILLSANECVGKLDLRLGMNDYLYYLGQIGYSVKPEYRGNNYAYKACDIVLDLAKNKYLMDEIFITCSPENIASYKTLLKLGGELIETIEVPEDHELYIRNEKVKCIFQFDLGSRYV